MKAYTAAIIGCGSIGALKPDKYDFPGGENILTHAHALWQHERTRLIAICDTDEEKAHQAAQKWECEPFVSIADLFHTFNPDIVIVATPTSTHADVLLDVLSYGPRLVIAEKPFCTSYVEAEVVVKAYENAGIPLVINYTRRYVPEIRKMRNEIANGSWGKIYHCQVNYNRGIMHDGSHAINLCNWFFGNFKRGGMLPADPEIIDLDPVRFNNYDITYAAYMIFENCPHVFFCPSDGRKFGLFEIHIMTEGGRISLVDHSKKITIQKLMLEPTYGDYKTLSSNRQHIITQLHTALTRLVNNVVDCLNYNTPLFCTGKEALEVHKIYESIVK